VEVDLTRYAGKPFRLELKAEGPAMAGAVFGQPEIWEHGSCRAGPNILLVVIDTLRADATGGVSGRKGVTPVLDALGRKGALFESCFAGATWTRPSMTALLASEWPSRLGLPRVGFKLKPKVRARIYTLLRRRLYTRYLKRLGYRTAAIGNNFFYLGHSSIGLDRGFDEVIDIRHPSLDTPAIAKVVGRYLKQNTDRPFFMWVHFDGPHWPYHPPTGYGVKGARAPGAPTDRYFESYLGEAQWADKHVGLILDHLKRLKLDGRTLVAATSDHGEIFSDAHTYDMSGHITRHRHGWSIYDEVLHVPLILAGPNVAVRRIRRPVSHLDLMPTLTDLAGLPPLVGARGRSLAKWIRSPARAEEPEEIPIVAEGRRQEAVRYKGLKFIRRRGFAASFTFRGSRRRVTRELYDLKADPAETRNLADKRKEDADRLNELLDRLLKQPSAAFEPAGGGGAAGSAQGAGAAGYVLYIRLWGGTKKGAARRLTARLNAGGPMAVASLSGPNVKARWIGDRGSGLVLDLTARSGELAQASIHLPAVPTHLKLELDGKPVKPKDILAGPFGLSALRKDPSPLTRKLVKILAARKPPIPPRTVNPRCALWTSVGGAAVHVPVEVPTDSASAPERQVDQLLRDWGYIKGASGKKGR
jgi:arylsulfatase A-like enzyme